MNTNDQGQSDREGARGVLELLDRPWCIVPSVLRKIETLAAAYLRGELELPAAAARSAAPRTKRREANGKIAVLPIQGILVQRRTWLSWLFEETSSEQFKEEFNAAVADPEISGIVLDVDSPGGEAHAGQEMAATVSAARGRKPIVALGRAVMASAAQWVAAAADRVLLASPIVLSGSIGTAFAHVDFSGADEKRGLKVIEVTAGKFKRIASQHRPLTAEGHAELQRMVDAMNDVFVADVARLRGIPEKEIRALEARVLIGQEAIEAGLSDGFSSIEEQICALSAQASLPSPTAQSAPSSKVMAAPPPEPRAIAPVRTEAEEAAATVEAMRGAGMLRTRYTPVAEVFSLDTLAMLSAARQKGTVIDMQKALEELRRRRSPEPPEAA